jgi:HAD superfamily hydrolase (TIGR01509 family)
MTLLDIPPPPALVVLDLDGVLVDSDFLEAEVLAARLAERGTPVPDVGRLIAGRTHAQGVDAVERASGTSFGAAWWRETDDLVRRAFSDRLRPLPGAVDLLAGLDARGLRWCIATNSRRASATLKVRASGLLPADREFALVAREELPEAKPSAAALAYVCRAMRTRPAECLVVDDSRACVTAALAAGARAVWFRPGRPAGTPEDLPVLTRLADVVARPARHPVVPLSRE